MQSIYSIITKKRDGHKLKTEDIQYFIDGVVQGWLPDYQAAALLMAMFIKGLDEEETALLTSVMLHSGEIIRFPKANYLRVDKHSTGGVGDKVSLILTPLVAACDVQVPMLSGRGLGHTGGTLDKLESIPGFTTALSPIKMEQMLADIGCFMAGQTEQVAPADRKLYALRDVTATVESIPLITASILAKKLAEGADAFVFDVKTGDGAFMETPDEAKKLAKALVKGCQSLNFPARALITSMDQPLGQTIGNSLEVMETINALKGEGAPDLMEVTYELATQMLLLSGKYNDIKAISTLLHEKISDGSALNIFAKLITAQGGEPEIIHDHRHLPLATRVALLKAEVTGFVSAFKTKEIGWFTVWLGAGRIKKEDSINPAVGLIIHKKLGDLVHRDEVIAEIHLDNRTEPNDALSKLRNMIIIDDKKPKHHKLIIERIIG
jgi:pyrimidine-nucleoside phosphorylase